MGKLFKADRISEGIKKEYYKGKPTRKYKQYLKYSQAIDRLNLLNNNLTATIKKGGILNYKF